MGSGYNFKCSGRKGATEHVLFNEDLKQMMELSGGKVRERVPVRGDSKDKGLRQKPVLPTCLKGIRRDS